MIFAAPMRFRTLMTHHGATRRSGACLRTSAWTTRRGGIRTSRRTTARLVMTAKAVKHAYCTHQPTPIGDLSMHQRHGSSWGCPCPTAGWWVKFQRHKARRALLGLPDAVHGYLHVRKYSISEVTAVIICPK